jgi:hypothetical protein
MFRPLIPALNSAVLELAPVFEARDVAPETFRDILPIRGAIVWSGASGQTIWADPQINHAFRAWHDRCHCDGAHDFTFAGEAATCERQISELLALYPRAPAGWLAAIRAEVTGQAEFFAMTGSFPSDQYAFVQQAINGAGL